MIPRRAKLAALLAAAALLAWALVALQAVLFPVLLALLLAYLLDPLVGLLERAGMPRSRAITAIYLSGLVLAALTGLFGVPWLAGQTAALLARLEELVHRLPEFSAPIGAWAERRLGVRGLSASTETLSGQARAWLLAHKGEAFHLTSGALGTALSGLKGLGVLLLDLVLVPVYAYFFLRGLDRLPGVLRDLLPVSYRERGMSILTQVHETMASFFRGRLLLCAGKGVVAALVLWIGDVPFGICLGLAAGVMSLVPFLSFPAAGFLGCALALLQGQGVNGLLWVLGGLGAAEAFETVAAPWVLGRSMSLHPAVVLFSLLVGGELLGAMGLLLAVPLASTVKILWKEILFPWWRELAEKPA